MAKTYRDHPHPIGVRLSKRNFDLLAALKIQHLNRNSLINRALDFGLERAIREVSKSIPASPN
jgi:hypothetical protein